MSSYLTTRHLGKYLLALAIFGATPMQSHAMDPKFKLDTTVLGKNSLPSPSIRPQADVRRAAKSAPTRRRLRAGKARKPAPLASSSDHRIMLAQEARERDAEVEVAREIWTRLIPSLALRGSDRFDSPSNAFSLSLDPERYPAFPAQDGGSILVDGRGTLPPLVRALIQDNNPQVRVVTENPTHRQRFYRSLLGASRFYSIEENFSVDFGKDPKITVRADFRIEKMPDSLMRQDLNLLNVFRERRATPQGVVSLLAKNGFQLLEAGSPSHQMPGRERDLIYLVAEKEPVKILDSFLDALSVPFETAKNIDLYARDNIGVRLDVPVHRYFEDNGRRYVVALFNGDPVNYTLIRLLETKGYRVIMLQEDDDFQSISEKLLSRLQLPGRYAEQDLWALRDVGYTVRMSGVKIHNNRNGYRNLFVTDRHLDSLVQELAELNGYLLRGTR